jgi:hypothetical protein
MNRILPLALVSLLTACSGTTDLEIVGTYADDFGGTHDITADTWTMNGVGVFHILSVDNDADWLVAQNDAANEFNPDLYSRMDWMESGGDLWFCQTAYDAATQADAEATAAAGSDPDTGCGGFSWTRLATP